MRFVYATRPLPSLEFATANQRDAIPDDAEIFAVCDGALTIRQAEAESLSALSVQEQSTLQELISEAQTAEVIGNSAIHQNDNPLRRILRRLLNI
jgi:hypothetical protein